MIRWLKAAGAGGVLAILLVGAAQADPITITDLAGRTIKLDRPAERIVTFPVPMAGTVIALDQSPDRLVGINPELEIAIDPEILGEFFPKARDIDSRILAGGATRDRSTTRLTVALPAEYRGGQGIATGPRHTMGTCR